MNTNIESLYQFLLMQQVAETYLEDVTLTSEQAVRSALVRGNNRNFGPQTGQTKFTDIQFEEFWANYKIVTQTSDRPADGSVEYLFPGGPVANTGFSATLIQKLDATGNPTSEFTLAIRSTESKLISDGGDKERDGYGADAALANTGFGWAQLDALEQYFGWLKSSGTLPSAATLNVTGYSLGGHLATVFTELHAPEINQTVTFNGAGRGTWNTQIGGIDDMLTYFRAVLANPDAAPAPSPTNTSIALLYTSAKAATGPLDATNIYADPRQAWASWATQQQFGTLGLLALGSNPARTGLANGAELKVTQLWGREFPNDQSWVANSGVHGPAVQVFIEDQPAVAGWPSLFPWGSGEYGGGHSIVLLADGLALSRALNKLDPSLTLDALALLLTRATNKTADGTLIPGGEASSKYEYDALENVLDALRRMVVSAGAVVTPYALGGYGYGDIDKRNGFHDNLKALADSAAFQSLIGKLLITSVTSDSTPLTANTAKIDFGEFVALKTLSPFSLLPNGAVASAAEDLKNVWRSVHSTDYTAWEADLALTPAQRACGEARFSDNWYTDRAEMLKWVVKANESDIDYTANNGRITGQAIAQPTLFDDKASNTRFTVSLQPLSQDALGVRRVIFGASNNDTPQTLTGADANDSLYGGDRADILIGNAGDDYLEGGAGIDDLQGGDGEDMLVGGADADALRGGANNDTLVGGQGNDAYYINSGEGTDTIIEFDKTGGAIIWDGDTLGGGLKLSDNVWRSADGKFNYAIGSANTLIITKTGAGGRVIVRDFSSPEPANPMLGLTLSADNLPVPMPVTTQTISSPYTYTYALDTLYDSAGNDRIESGGGEDTIFAHRGGDDVIITGGDVELSSPDLQYTGRYSEPDQVEAGGGNDYVETGYGPDWIDAGAGSDWIVSGPGEDAIFTSHNFVGHPWNGPNTWNINQYFTVYTRPEITDYFDPTAPYQFLYLHTIRGISFVMPWSYLGKVNAIDEPNVPEFVFAGEGTDLVVGGAGTDIVFGESGTDWVQGHGGHDLIDGGADADILQGDQPVTDLYFDEFHPGSSSEQGDDTIFGRDGNDLINGGGGQDYLDGGGGDDILDGGAGDDFLVGAKGSDQMEGGPGNDEYFFSVGDGADQITDASGKNRIRFGDALARLDVGLQLAGGGGLLLTYSTGAQQQSISAQGAVKFKASTSLADSITLDWRGEVIDAASIPATVPDLFVSFAGEEEVRIQDLIVATPGTSATIVGTEAADTLLDLAGDDLLQGGAGDDAIYGLVGNNRLEGGAGNDLIVGLLGTNAIDGGTGNDVLIGGLGADQIDGGGGDDTLFGAAGEDVLRGGDGDDIYVLRSGIGHDEVLDSTGSADVIKVAGGLRPQDIAVTRDATHIFLHIAGSSDRIAIQWYGSAANQIEQVQFEDRTVWTAANLEQFAAQWLLDTTGTEGDDSLWGSAAPESISGLGGNDSIGGGGGDDVLDGGPGDDTLSGDDGQDLLIGGTGNDWLIGDRRSGSSRVDTLIGGPGDDTYVVDSLDIVVEAPDEGYDTIETDSAGVLPDKVEALLLYGNQPVDVYGNALDNAIEGNDADNLVAAGDGDDVIRGWGGDDALQGDAGDDYLDGGEGNDTLTGGAGDDDYYLAWGAGQDLVIDESSTVRGDRVLLAPDLTPADVSLTRDAGDMVLSILGTTDELRIRWFDSPNHRIESVEFADGTVWNLNTDGTIATTGAGPIVANTIDIVNTDEDAALSWVVPADTFANADGASFSAASLGGGALPLWLTFDGATRTFSGTPGNAQVGEVQLQITASDALGRAATEPFIFKVNNINDAPSVVGALPDVSATEDALFALAIPSVFADVDVGDSLQLSATRADGSALPNWLTFDPAARAFSGTPLNADVGGLPVRVTATDVAGAKASDDFAIMVTNTNDAPLLAVALDDRSITTNATTDFSVPAGSFIDQDAGDVLTYSATQANGAPLPTWLTLDPVTGRFVASPANSLVGQVAVRLQATDSAGASATDNFDLFVTARPGVILNGTDNRDLLVGESGWDSLQGKGEIDYLGGGGGSDTLAGGFGSDVLDGDGFVWNDVYATRTLVVPSVEEGDDVLDGGVGNDVLRGGGGNDTLLGGEHEDRLSGQGGNDALRGGPGINLLFGGDEGVTAANGNDTYLHGAGDGFDTIEDLDSTPGNHDELEFDAGINPSSVVLRQNGTGLQVFFPTEAHRVEIRNYFSSSTPASSPGAGQIEAILFSSGVSWDFAAVQSILASTDNQSKVAGLYGVDSATYVYTAFATFDQNSPNFYSYIPDSNSPTEYTYSMPAGNTTGDTIVGGRASDVISGGGGRDLLIAGEGSHDRLQGNDGDDMLIAGSGGNVLDGGSGNDVLIGGAGEDAMLGGAGNDVIDAGKGNEFNFRAIDGGPGSDIYIYRRGDGDDSMVDYVDWYYGIYDDGSTDTLRFADINPNDVVLAWDYLDGKQQGRRFYIDGGAASVHVNFIERVEFADGTVWSKADINANTVLSSEFDDYRFLSTIESPFHGLGGNDTIEGTAADDQIYGDSGSDLLYGGAGGKDQLFGGEGNDRLVMGYPDPSVFPRGGAFIAAPGNGLLNGGPGADQLFGGNGNDVLDGGPGADEMRGGVGDDTYFADDALDKVSDDSGGSGFNEIVSSVSFNMQNSGCQKLTLVGSAISAIGSDWNDLLAGNALNNLLDGYAGDDRLTGGAGADQMIGGDGNDTFVVEDAGDSVLEENADRAIGGTDVIEASISFLLPQNVENLTLTGSGRTNGTGNSLNNVITGNAGANRLDGGAGTDTLSGGAGDDTYVIDSGADVVVEAVGGGADTIESSVTYTLQANVENLKLTGTVAINGTGNELDNFLIGNTGANTLTGGVGNDRLDGGAGADSMIGGLGDDSYVIDNASDAVTERSGEGNDVVEAGVTYTLGSNVEHLILTGAGAINGTGNSANNYLRGNTAANTLSGGTGLDVLQGGGGDDNLQDAGDPNLFDGGAGADTISGSKNAEFFVGGLGSDTITLGAGADIIGFNRGDGADLLNSPAAKSSGAGEKNDTISLGGVRLSDIRLARLGTDLLFKIAGTTDIVRLKDWYASTNNQTVSTLQSVVYSTSDYNPTSADQLVNRRVIRLNFTTLVNAFNAAYNANPFVGDWAVPASTLNSSFVGGSDSLAFGGDLAYRYARDGNFSGLDVSTASAALGNANFGTAPQAFMASPTVGGMRLLGITDDGTSTWAAQMAAGAVASDTRSTGLSMDIETLWAEEPELRFLSEGLFDPQADEAALVPSADSSMNLTDPDASLMSEIAYGVFGNRNAEQWSAMEKALRQHLGQGIVVAGGEAQEAELRRPGLTSGLQWLASGESRRDPKHSLAEV